MKKRPCSFTPRSLRMRKSTAGHGILLLACNENDIELAQEFQVTESWKLTLNGGPRRIFVKGGRPLKRSSSILLERVGRGGGDQRLGASSGCRRRIVTHVDPSRLGRGQGSVLEAFLNLLLSLKNLQHKTDKKNMSPVSRVRTEGVRAEGCTAICRVIMAEKKLRVEINTIESAQGSMKGGWLAGWLHATGPFEWEGRGEPDDALSRSLSTRRSIRRLPGRERGRGLQPRHLSQGCDCCFFMPLDAHPQSKSRTQRHQGVDFLLHLLRPLRVRLKCSGTDGCSDENKLAANKETRPLHRAIFTLIIGI
jgi:hypothetical protein